MKKVSHKKVPMKGVAKKAMSAGQNHPVAKEALKTTKASGPTKTKSMVHGKRTAVKPVTPRKK